MGNEIKLNEVEKPNFRNQYIAATVGSLSCLCAGLFVGWPSYTNPMLLSKDSAILSQPISPTYASLISGIPNLAMIVCIPALGWFFDKYGRKKCALLLVLPFAISWILILLAPSAEYIIVARFLAGLGGAGTLNVPPIYIGETADKAIRGAMGSFPTVLFGMGILVSYIVGNFTGYYTTIVLFLGIVIAYGILMSFMPETPIFLVRKGRQEEAAKSIAWLRRVEVHSPEAIAELLYLQQIVKNNVGRKDSYKDNNNDISDFTDAKHNDKEIKPLQDQKLSVSDSDATCPAWKYLFLDRASRNGFFVAIMLFSFQVTNGMYAIQNYTTVIFRTANTGIPEKYCAIIYAATLVLGSLVTTFLADRSGRKILMVGSCSGLGLVLILFGFTLHTGYGPAILPAIFLCLSGFIFSIGASPVPAIILGEYFSPKVKEFASCVLVQYSGLACFVVIYFFQTGVEMIGFQGMFYFYGTLSLASAICCLIFQPETKGLPLEDILMIFGGDKDARSQPYKVIPSSEIKV